MLEIGTPGSTRRGWRRAHGEPTRARSCKRRIQPREASGAPRQSSTLLMRGCWRRSDGPLEGDTRPEGEIRLGLARPVRHRACALLYSKRDGVSLLRTSTGF